MIYSVQAWAGQDYAATVAAYGIITRIMTFAFLPLLGLKMATQTIVGNNFGAKLWARSDASLGLGLLLALVYCALFEGCFCPPAAWGRCSLTISQPSRKSREFCR